MECAEHRNGKKERERENELEEEGEGHFGGVNEHQVMSQWLALLINSGGPY